MAKAIDYNRIIDGYVIINGKKFIYCSLGVIIIHPSGKKEIKSNKADWKL
jgi:hypothetical protein